MGIHRTLNFLKYPLGVLADWPVQYKVALNKLVHCYKHIYTYISYMLCGEPPALPYMSMIQPYEITCVHTSMQIHMNTNTHACTLSHMQTHIRTYTHACMHAHTHARMHTHTHPFHVVPWRCTTLRTPWPCISHALIKTCSLFAKCIVLPLSLMNELISGELIFSNTSLSIPYPSHNYASKLLP